MRKTLHLQNFPDALKTPGIMYFIYIYNPNQNSFFSSLSWHTPLLGSHQHFPWGGLNSSHLLPLLYTHVSAQVSLMHPPACVTMWGWVPGQLLWYPCNSSLGRTLLSFGFLPRLNKIYYALYLNYAEKQTFIPVDVKWTDLFYHCPCTFLLLFCTDLFYSSYF